MPNVDKKTVAGFGQEWKRFDQSDVHPDEARSLFERYFRIFPWRALPSNPVGFDLGCGSGRWAVFVAPKVAFLHCIDASPDALEVAQANLSANSNCAFHCAGVDSIPLADGSMDFGYCLGVLHHVPDPAAGLATCVAKLKPGAPFLLYLYYAFDNRPKWFRFMWLVSDVLRRAVSRMPFKLRSMCADGLAGLIYLPLARVSRFLERAGFATENIPLSSYRNLSFYAMRTDSLDRFGTRLEKRFTAAQIEAMMHRAGLADIRFSDQAPYWCAVGYKGA